MTCPDCGAALVYTGVETHTLVGYGSPMGHDHDDNCVVRLYRCPAGHDVALSIRRRCPRAGCDWAGKAACFCHPGAKVDAWPEVVEVPAPRARLFEDIDALDRARRRKRRAPD